MDFHTLTADNLCMSAADRGWGWPGAPGTKEEARYRKQNIITIHPVGIALPVHRRVAPLFERFLAQLVLTGYRLDEVQDDWGYSNRDVRGQPGVKSNHSWGLAIDVNATRNPMTTNGRLVTDLPRGVSGLAARFGFRWGGDYTGSRKDPMHFEFMGTPDDVERYLNRTVTPKEDIRVTIIRHVADIPGPDGRGAWVLGIDGGVFAVGGAPFYGSYPGLPPADRQGARSFVDIQPFQGGYMLVANDGATYHFPAK